MINRALTPLLKDYLAKFPAVALRGPRQCGKTTLAKSLGGAYFDLQQPESVQSLDLQWNKLCAGKDLVILDEAQVSPPLFPRLRGAIDDERSRRGRFLLLGSVSPALTKNISESLAGRIGHCELTPLLLGESHGADLDERWLKGGFPEALESKGPGYPLWQDQYLQTLAGRDLPLWGLNAKPMEMTRFIQILAGMHGKLWNASDAGRNMGLSYHTANQYLDMLEGAYLVRRLQPFSKEIGKRVLRHPKIYWRDSGLAHALLRVGSVENLYSHPAAGATWESFCIEQILGRLLAAGKTFTPSFLRTSDGREIDLLLEMGRDLWAIEIKLSTSPALQDLEKLDSHAALAGANRKILISRTAQPAGNPIRSSTHLEGAIQYLLAS